MQHGEDVFVAGAERGDEPGEERAERDDADGERGHHPVDVDGFDAGHVVAVAQEPLERGGGEKQAEERRRRPRAAGFHQAFAQQAQPSAAHGGADGELLAARRGAGDQQIGDVDAGDEKHAAGGGQQDIERALDIADHVIEQRARCWRWPSTKGSSRWASWRRREIRLTIGHAPAAA